MNYWIVPSNESKFQFSKVINDNGTVIWRKNNRYENGDILFIYKSHSKERGIVCKMIVEDVNALKSEYIAQEDFWKDKAEYKKGLENGKFVRFKLLANAPENNRLTFEDLRSNGLNNTLERVQRVIKVGRKGEQDEKGEKLLNYILKQFEGVLINDQETVFEYPEGVREMISVNRFERNVEARQKCLEVKGCSCAVCGMNFEKIYGEIGKNFIHVHHIKPLSEIGQEYQVNPINDLVPVCPNCHAMLHRIAGRTLSVKELKQRMEEAKK